MDETEKLIAEAIKYHGIDVPVHAIRQEGENVIIVIQGGQELRCKLEELIYHHRDPRKRTEASAEKKKELKRFDSDQRPTTVKKTNAHGK